MHRDNGDFLVTHRERFGEHFTADEVDPGFDPDAEPVDDDPGRDRICARCGWVGDSPDELNQRRPVRVEFSGHLRPSVFRVTICDTCLDDLAENPLGWSHVQNAAACSLPEHYSREGRPPAWLPPAPRSLHPAG